MTKRTECDRCHTTITPGLGAQVHLAELRTIAEPAERDLCALCTAGLLRWIKAGLTDAELHAGAQV